MNINITINDPDLEARLTDYYNQGKVDDESFDMFCGRLVLSQMVGFELQVKIRAQETTMKETRQKTLQTLTEQGEKTIKDWTESVLKTASKTG